MIFKSFSFHVSSLVKLKLHNGYYKNIFDKTVFYHLFYLFLLCRYHKCLEHWQNLKETKSLKPSEFFNQNPANGFSQSWWVAWSELEPGSPSCHSPLPLIVKNSRSNDMPCLFLLSANWILSYITFPSPLIMFKWHVQFCTAWK